MALLLAATATFPPLILRTRGAIKGKIAVVDKLIYLMLFVIGTPISSAAEGSREVNVSSDEVQYSSDGTGAVFTGNVQVNAGGLQLQATSLKVNSEGESRTYQANAGEQTPLLLTCNDCADFVIQADIQKQAVFNDENNRLQLTGGLSVCADDACQRGKITADSADWQQQKLTLRGAPTVHGTWQLPETTETINMQAQQVIYHLDTGEVELAGDAQIERGGNTITGTAIHFNVNTGALKAESSTEQRVQATFGGDG